MSLFKPKGSSLWYFSFYVKGIRYHGPTGTACREDAKEVESAERERVRRSRFFPDERKKPQMTVKAAFDRYYVEVSEHLASADNHLSYMSRLLTIGADKNLSDITEGDIATMVARRRGQKARYSKLRVSNATVNRETQLLGRIYSRAQRVWKVDVGDDIDWSSHYLHEADERVRELTAEEETKLFKHLRQDFRPMVKFALVAGMRLANIVRLTWKQIDFAGAQITIKMKSKKPGGRVHSVPITPSLRTLLTNEQGKHPIYVFTYQCEKSRAKRKKGQRYPFSHDGWRKSWRAALEAAGVEDFRFHDTRHTAATRIVRATGNIKVAQKLLGHTDISATTRYAHVTKDDVMNGLLEVERQGIDKFDENDDTENAEKRQESN